jgi:hypothetical protein
MATRKRTETQLIVLGFYHRLPDGRWGCDPRHPNCAAAEGLAAKLLASNATSRPVSEICLTCSNWNARIGCVFGHNLSLDETAGKAPDFGSVFEQSRAWLEAGNLDRAIARLEKFLRTRPAEPEACLLLGQLYDRADYSGPDKHRALELYAAYTQMKGPTGVPEPLASWLKHRMDALVVRSPQLVPSEPGIRVLMTFTCFYRFALLMQAAYVALTRDCLFLAPIGYLDPASGRMAVEMGRPYEQGTRILRWVTGERSRDRELELARHELNQASQLPLTRLAAEKCTQAIELGDGPQAVRMTRDLRRCAEVVSFKTGRTTHELIFAESQRSKAEQCVALLNALGEIARAEAAAADAAQAAVPHPA